MQHPDQAQWKCSCCLPQHLWWHGRSFACKIGCQDGTRECIMNMCLNREGFQAIPHIIAYKDQNMMVVVEGRRPLYWACKQIGHFARSCPQKTTKPTATTTAATLVTSPSKPVLEPRDHPEKEWWTQVICKGRNPPPKNKATIMTTATTTEAAVEATTIITTTEAIAEATTTKAVTSKPLASRE